MHWLPAPLRTTRRLLITVLAAVVVVVGLVAVAGQASSPPSLPATTPQRLLTDTIRSLAAQPSVSGRARVHVDVGLPSLPDEGPAASNGLLSFLASLSGDHLVKVWHSVQGVRIADLLRGSERDLVANSHEAWLWDFGTMTAYHLGPFAADAGRTARGALGLVDPVQASTLMLEALSPTTRVTLGEAQRVAGRDAYTLVLQPRMSATLVGSVRIAIDATRFVPLGIGLYPRGWSDPALSATFTSVAFGPIPGSTFGFSPPPGAKVVQLGQARVGSAAGSSAPGDASPADEGEPPLRTFGAGWATVVAVRTPAPSSIGSHAGVNVRSFLPFTGPLFSVRLLDRGSHGWLMFGAVPQSTLAATEPELP